MAPEKRKDPGDIDGRSRAESSPEASDSKSISGRSKAAIRVSLACVQCRSKHVKCDATQPACGRCVAEGKPCYYTKSRRGIRDPKKRSLILDEPPRPPLRHVSPATKDASTALPVNSPNRLSNGWTVPRRANTATDESLISAFFDHFHFGHPILPPKRYFLQYAESDPNSYHFLLAVVDFCGGLYTRCAHLSELREAAYSMACGSLPFTVQSVQGLHILAIVAFGESKFSHHIGFANRCWAMAIELGMHQKSFADCILDPVWAESCRRTWWYTRYQGLIRRVHKIDLTVDIQNIESDADVPYSEEWEYQSGEIPLPISLSQYEREVDLGRSDFPSLAFQIEMCRIQTDITISCDESACEDEERIEVIDQLDSKICDFLRRVPRWKMDVGELLIILASSAGRKSDRSRHAIPMVVPVDPDGRPDQVIFGAVAWAHISRIRLRQSSLRSGLNLREYFPLGPACGPDHKGQAVKRFGWNPHSVDIEAANSLCDMFRRSFPIKSIRPMMVPGLLRVAIVYLDACVFLGLDSPVFRERIHALIRILRIHGETWPLSKRIAEDIQIVANDYLVPKGLSTVDSDSDSWNNTVTDVPSSGPLFEPSTMPFNPYSFLDSHMQSVLLNYREPEQNAFSTFLTEGLAPTSSGPC
ncbi:hypothetical protein O1611_g4008 [Lasiodiplodia mahajangana]|uniref:Uncharacterized protein n=1 Tax=Lasiodiplodia mahajangana TaxID=1108764 RepID=A0ACC2JQ34_9PEZI|nr:hypothetical protein O1611_g4008 [Lasiodiplodia mahajangana]